MSRQNKNSFTFQALLQEDDTHKYQGDCCLPSLAIKNLIGYETQK